MAFIKAENAVPEETERHDWRRQKKAAEEDGTPGKIRRSVPEMEESMETESCAVNREHEKMIRWLQTVKFRRVLFGGIEEAQLWKTL